MGFLERFTRWPADDQLIEFSSRGHYIGYRVVTDAFLNWFPHALLPNKDSSQAGYSGNYYLHEMGGLADDDTSTGISFSPMAEAFHMDGWLSLAMVAPLIWFLLFLSVDLLCGDIRESPWGLFFALSFAHIAPEGALAGVILFIWHGNIALFVGMVFCIYAAPFVGALLTGGARRARLLHAQPALQPAD